MHSNSIIQMSSCGAKIVLVLVLKTGDYQLSTQVIMVDITVEPSPLGPGVVHKSEKSISLKLYE